MPLVAAPKRRFIQTAADLPALLKQLGDIPPERVRMRPLPGTANETDLIRLVERKLGKVCELVDGTLVDKNMGVEADFVALNIAYLLIEFTRPLRLGVVLGSHAMQRLAPGLIRIPDVTFVNAKKWRAWSRNRPAVADFAPDLAVEVLSRSNTRAEMKRKRQEYFAAGCQLVWEASPRRKSVAVYTSPTAFKRLTEADTLTGDPVVLGFRVKVAELFADPLA